MIALQFFGTSAGMPTSLRNVTGLGLRLGNKRGWMLVDCGDGTQRQIIKAGESLVKLSAVLITHLHGDHVLGLTALLGSRSLLKAEEELTVVGPRGLAAFIHTSLQATATALCFPLTVIEIDEQWPGVELLGYHVTAIPLVHSVVSYAYKLVERRNENAVARKPLSIVVGGDNGEAHVLLPHLPGVDVLIHEATYNAGDGAQRKGRILHTSTEELAQVADQARVPYLVATHISPRYQNSGEKMAAYGREIEACYGGRFFVAEDFARFVLKKDGIFAPQPKES